MPKKPRDAPRPVDRKQLAASVVKRLATLYPDAHCALSYTNAYELIVATILSAQCTDARVNLVTPALFARFPSAAELARAETQELERLIHSAGFFRAKTRHLIGMAAAVVERHEGAVPADLDALTALPGVGRKTAHVVLGNAFGIPSGVVVDTHVKRLAFRIGLTDRTDPVPIEHELAALVPSKSWIDLSHRLIEHGRRVCLALRPKCEACELRKLCARQGVGGRDDSETDLAGAIGGR